MSDSQEKCAPCTPIHELTEKNYGNGFLIDDELMGAVGPLENGQYFAYVLQHSTGEYLGYEEYTDLHSALLAINQVKRSWTFEKLGGCDGTRCAEGTCKGTGCKAFRSSGNLKPAAAPDSSTPTSD